MQRISEKLLPILLTLLLGLSPLQGVAAGFDVSFPQGETAHQMEEMSGAMDMEINDKGMDCEQCGHGNGCVGYDCSSGHCAFCAVAIPQVFFYSGARSSAPHFDQITDGFENRLASNFFRPPRI